METLRTSSLPKAMTTLGGIDARKALIVQHELGLEVSRVLLTAAVDIGTPILESTMDLRADAPENIAAVDRLFWKKLDSAKGKLSKEEPALSEFPNIFAMGYPYVVATSSLLQQLNEKIVLSNDPASSKLAIEGLAAILSGQWSSFSQVYKPGKITKIGAMLTDGVPVVEALEKYRPAIELVGRDEALGLIFAKIVLLGYTAQIAQESLINMDSQVMKHIQAALSRPLALIAQVTDLQIKTNAVINNSLNRLNRTGIILANERATLRQKQTAAAARGAETIALTDSQRKAIDLSHTYEVARISLDGATAHAKLLNTGRNQAAEWLSLSERSLATLVTVFQNISADLQEAILQAMTKVDRSEFEKVLRSYREQVGGRLDTVNKDLVRTLEE